MRKIRRSMLFVPGGVTKFVDKALATAADGIIFDLEDAVSPDRKAEARSWVGQVLQSVNFGKKERCIRINGLHTVHVYEDIAAIIPERPDSVVLPKVNDREDIAKVHALISAAETQAGIETGSTALFAFIESPRGVENVVSMAASCPRLTGFLFGAVDYTRTMQSSITDSRVELYYAMSRILSAARIAGIDALDSVCVSATDMEKTEREARQAMLLGYDGKLAIHPDQVEAINRVFTPSTDEIRHWTEVVDALRSACQSGRGVATVNGNLVEKPHIFTAARILSVADIAGLLNDSGKERLQWANDMRSQWSNDNRASG